MNHHTMVFDINLNLKRFLHVVFFLMKITVGGVPPLTPTVAGSVLAVAIILRLAKRDAVSINCYEKCKAGFIWVHNAVCPNFKKTINMKSI